MLNHELMLRVGFADRGTVDDLLAALDAAEAQLARMYAEGIEQVEGYLADGGPYPERLHLLALASDFNGRFLELCHDWIDEVRAEAAGVAYDRGSRPDRTDPAPAGRDPAAARSIRWRTGESAVARRRLAWCAMATEADVRKIALSLPETSERPTYGRRPASA